MSRFFLLLFAEEERRRSLMQVQRRQIRDTSDPLQLPENEFIAHFRLTKVGFQQVVEELTPYLPVNQRNTAVRNELKILAALNFFANGSYQRNVGASIYVNLSQPKISMFLHEVVNALNAREILSKFIKFPSDRRERELNMRNFMEKFGFPGIIGCIDGTHVALIRPNDHEESFLNRKNYHSLNVLIICDVHLNILHVDASFGGASHDSYVWNQSAIKAYFERIDRNGERCWLLGDSGYAQRPWMMTPILGAAPGTPDDYYTKLHCRVRNTVERCIGLMKARWRCLLAHKVLHYDPVTVGKIVNACVVLHNIANAHNVPVNVLEDEDVQLDQQRQVFGGRIAHEIPDNSRDILVNRLWNARR